MHGIAWVICTCGREIRAFDHMDIDYNELSDRIKLLAHPERLRILDALRRDSECVCHLEALLGKPQPYVSQQLRVLRDAGVISDEKQGQNVFYRLIDVQLNAWLDVILGPVNGDLPEMARHRQVIACVCPKCTPQSSDPTTQGVSVIELS